MCSPSPTTQASEGAEQERTAHDIRTVRHHPFAARLRCVCAFCFHRKHATHSMYQFKLHPACTCTCCQRAPSCVLGMPSVITTAANSYHRLIEKIYSGQDFFFRKKFHTRTHLLIIMHAMLYSKRFPCIRVHISAINVHTCFELHPTTSSLTLFIHMLVTLFVFLPPPLSIFFFPFP